MTFHLIKLPMILVCNKLQYSFMQRSWVIYNNSETSLFFILVILTHLGRGLGGDFAPMGRTRDPLPTQTYPLRCRHFCMARLLCWFSLCENDTKQKSSPLWTRPYNIKNELVIATVFMYFGPYKSSASDNYEWQRDLEPSQQGSDRTDQDQNLVFFDHIFVSWVLILFFQLYGRV